MKSRERMERAVTFSRPDRTPIDLPTIAPGVEVYMKELQLPDRQAVADIVHKHGRRLIQHCCGAVRELLPNFIRAGIDLVQPIQPGLPGNDVEELRNEFGKEVVLFRGLDMQQQMRNDSPQKITEFYKRLFERFGDGGLIMNVWAMPDIPLKNMLAFRAAYMN